MPYSFRQVIGDALLGGISATVTNAVYSMPAGYTLGEERMEGGIMYRLCYNAGNSVILPGLFASPGPVAGSTPYSVSVSTAADVGHHVGAVLAHHATVPTDCYFWGAFRGFIASGFIATSITQLAGNASKLSTDGCVKPVTNTAASCYVASANMAIVFTTVSPTAGTVAVRQSGGWLVVP